MDAILKEIGYTQGTVGERMKALAKDPEYKFSEGDKGRAEIMAFIQDRLDWIRAQMPRAFNTVVNPNMEVKRLPPEEEPGAPAAYGGAGSIDGKIPGRFWINLQNDGPAQQVQPRRPDVPRSRFPATSGRVNTRTRCRSIRQLLAFNAYSEGWALYAEQLADELGAYDNDPRRAPRLPAVDRLPRLPAGRRHRHPRQALDARAGRQVLRRRERIESRGSRQRSRSLLLVARTGVRLQGGHSEINRQREKAKTALGAKFDLKAFDDTVVLGGNVPLDVLAKNVDEYIRTAKG